uniref:SLX9 ribosome biosis factor n=1 Tax=Podarcis muralis TaxID=64176 RepID=A0A670HUL9_PODMU
KKALLQPMALGSTYSGRPKGAVCTFRAQNKALHKMTLCCSCLCWDQVFMTSNVFAGVKIDPKSLVKTLDIDVKRFSSEDEKVLLPKKEKMKLRKERWLQKIENIKLAKQQQKAEAKRKATPVVGDLHPLMDALPELSDLVAVSIRKPRYSGAPQDECLARQKTR